MVPEDKPAQALSLFKKWTFPDSSRGGVLWNVKANETLAARYSHQPFTWNGTTRADVDGGNATEAGSKPRLVIIAHPRTHFSISVVASGGYTSDPHLYLFQWQKDGVALVDQTSKALRLLEPSTCHEGVYRCIVATLDGAVVATEPMYLTVNDEQTIGDLDDNGWDQAQEIGLLAWGLGTAAGIVIGCYGNAKIAQYKSQKDGGANQWQRISIEGDEQE